MNQFAFLVGAHKTGTTFINKVLLHNQDLLETHHIRFSASGSVREGLTNYIAEPFISDNTKKKINDYVWSDSDRYKRAIFSHENISGTIPSFVENNAFYPNIESRISNLNKLLKSHPIDIFFVIREYESHILSCYSECIRNMGFISFEEFHNTVFRNPPSWVEIISNIKNAYPNAKVNILEQRSLKSDPISVFHKILGDDSVTPAIPTEIYTRPSISQTGLQVLELLFESKGVKKLPGKTIDKLAKLLPKNDVFGKLDLLNNGQKLKYRELYEKDRKELGL